MRAHGSIRYNELWNLTPKRKMAIERLSELGVTVGSSIGKVNFTLMIPYELGATEYIEIGYLMAQLGEEQFPEEYQVLSGRSSPLFTRVHGTRPPVEFSESYPEGLKYRVYKVTPLLK